MFNERYDETEHNPGPFATFMKDCSIDAQYTMHNTPQQNGITERRNHTMLDMMQCMLMNFTLPNYCREMPLGRLLTF